MSKNLPWFCTKKGSTTIFITTSRFPVHPVMKWQKCWNTGLYKPVLTAFAINFCHEPHRKLIYFPIHHDFHDSVRCPILIFILFGLFFTKETHYNASITQRLNSFSAFKEKKWRMSPVTSKYIFIISEFEQHHCGNVVLPCLRNGYKNVLKSINLIICGLSQHFVAIMRCNILDLDLCPCWIALHCELIFGTEQTDSLAINITDIPVVTRSTKSERNMIIMKAMMCQM